MAMEEITWWRGKSAGLDVRRLASQSLCKSLYLPGPQPSHLPSEETGLDAFEIPSNNTSDSILIRCCVKNQPGHQISSFLVRPQLSFSFLLFKHHHHIKMKTCLSKEIMLTLMKSQIPTGILSVTRYWEYLT